MKLSRYIDSSPLGPAMTFDEVRAAIAAARKTRPDARGSARGSGARLRE